MSSVEDINKSILVINQNICLNIEHSKDISRGFLSQNILSQLRNFIEHIMLKIYVSDGNSIGSDRYQNICHAISYVDNHGNYKVLSRFHCFLQIVASHYTMSEDNSERLMLKYYEYLFKIKKFMFDKYQMLLLHNLNEFPIAIDHTLQDYYEKIACKIDLYDRTISNYGKTERFYILKKKPFFVKEKLYFEITFTAAKDFVSKSNRIIAFTNLDILDNYAVKLNCVEERIEILDFSMPILVVNHWEVSIRDCEFNNFMSVILGTHHAKVSKQEKTIILQILTNSGLNLVDILSFSDEKYNEFKLCVLRKAPNSFFLTCLNCCRKIIKDQKKGCNLLRYMLFNLHNVFIKDQLGNTKNNKLSDLYLSNGCIPFDSHPYVFFPKKHTPLLSDIFECIPIKDREYELIARYVKNNTEVNGQLFTPQKKLQEKFDNIKSMVELYNSSLWVRYRESQKLVIENGQVFINNYKNETVGIIDRLQKISQKGIQNYSNKISLWLNDPRNGVDCEEKKKVMLHMFSQSRVALIYGSAGTGKSTLIHHLSNYFSINSKLFLAQTNPAVDNLRGKVSSSNCTFMTIAKFLTRSSVVTDYDIIVIDECSTVSNHDMMCILNKCKFKLIILVGDTFQISSIRFGNWFNVARAFIPKTAVSELTYPYRTEDKGLLELWRRVRDMNDSILESIIHNDYSSPLNSSIFCAADEDEVILCLNYDGLYGINNINRFLQERNPNKSLEWGIQRFKIGDPVLFNENNRLGPSIYNNMKGKIRGIQIDNKNTPQERIVFDIELEKIIDGMEIFNSEFVLVDNEYKNCKNSVIRFYVNKLKNTDEDDDLYSSDVIPFQIAYAVSIHKAQGLEYRSVKIVITEEADELISHNIFYTAITRAKKKLKIYWTPEVEKKVLSSIKPKEIGKDISILKKYV